MADEDPPWSARRAGGDLADALRFFSRLPVPAWDASADRAPSFRTLPAVLPFAGALIGGFGAVALLVAAALGLGSLVSAAVGIAALAAVTGALHEDGLADVADGFGAGGTAERRLAIMRDSRIGAFGALALGLALILRVGALATLLDRMGPGAAAAALVIAASVSRTAAVTLMAALPPARSDGASHAVGRPTGTAVAVGWAGAALLAVALCAAAGFSILSPLIALHLAALATLAMGLLAHRKIGGQTGDVIGAAQQAAEIACLLGLLIAARP